MPEVKTNDIGRSPWAVLALALAGGSGGAVLVPAVAPSIYRPQPFTLTMAHAMEERTRAMEERILRRVATNVRDAKREADLNLREVEQNIRRDMPPDETKRRIQYLEAVCKKVAPAHNFECLPPSIRFSSD